MQEGDVQHVVRGFWRPRKESARDIAARGHALLERLRAIHPLVFGRWKGLARTGEGRRISVGVKALTDYLLEQNRHEAVAQRRGYLWHLSTGGRSYDVDLGGCTGGFAQQSVLTLLLTARDGEGPSLPYANVLQALAETWDIDLGEVTDTTLFDALEADGLHPGEPSVGRMGYLSARRAALLADGKLALPGVITPARTGGRLMDFTVDGTVSVRQLVMINRRLRKAGVLAPVR